MTYRYDPDLPTPPPIAPRPSRLLPLAIALAAAFLLWRIDALEFILYPFRLFVTFVHESGHGLAALISGGQWRGFTVFPNGEGVAITAGGARWLILPAGYLGAAIFGAGLFYLAHTVPRPRAISVILGIGLAAITVLYTGLLTPNFSFTAFAIGLGSAAVLMAIGLRGRDSLNLFTLNLLSIMTSLNAIFDLFAVVQYSGQFARRDDASAFSAAVFPLIPGVVWGVVWAAMAIGILGAAVYFSTIRPLRKRLLES